MTKAPPTRKPVAFHAHDHTTCAAQALDAAERLASKAGLRLTPVRRRTLEILLEAHRALGAYEVLDRLAQDGFGAQPPVAYRALEFLVKTRLAHRIERLNAFTACMHPGQDHAPAFLICRVCKKIAEIEVPAGLGGAARSIGYEVESMHVELLGLCPNCVSEGMSEA